MDHAIVNHVGFGFVSRNSLQHGLHCKADFVGDFFDFVACWLGDLHHSSYAFDTV